MKGWDIVALEDLGKITSSKRIFKKDYVDSGIPFYRTKEIKELANGKEVSTELFISRDSFNEIKAKFGTPSVGDLLITAIGTVGEIYVVDRTDFYFKDGNVLWLRDFKAIEPNFLKYALIAFVDEINSLSHGSTYKALPIEKLKKHKIYKPSISEQKRIVAILDEAFEGIDAAIANTQKNLANARELFESYLNGIFTRKGDGWVEKKLGEICHKVEYGSSSKSQPEGDIPVIRMGNIQNNMIDWTDLVYTSNPDEINRYLLQYNDVLFNRTNSADHVGKSAIYKGEKPAIFAGYLIRVHYKKDVIDPDFLNFYLNCYKTREYGKSVMSRSVNQVNINGTKLKNYPIYHPDLYTQKQIIKKLYFLFRETQRLETIYRRKLEALQELKQSILQKAFTGELTNEKAKDVAA
ncbi:restriction modification system DNA specificity domain [Limnospira maxima CS-328]|uniref:Restriction modification system DNA specificity domain n=1 Tax=Limnospira maxima CS-328 TaxID=513049 RepID=B5VW93_LIMMA|nr:restriction endonuclease subunit S [Limnospira maxima]EDZ96454.1 restriction modification system DNA specificity domain [Limnospira maxima CS-328]MDC0836663.1 restriction endonuclease subunit S [Limnoraphis robusta]